MTTRLWGVRAPRDAAVVVIGTLLAVAGLIAGVSAATSEQRSVESAPVERRPPPTVPRSPARPPAVALNVAQDAPRQPVNAPSDFPGSLGSASPEALAAYQRAAAVLDTAGACGLDWAVLAAVGRVESDHGRGPAVGKPLDGRGGRGQVADTDGGLLDGDPRWDAPVGPLRLLPATWTSVAVDADADGVRDPRDLDDASLAAAVLLCAGQDLGTRRGLRSSLAAYDRAPGFVRAVLRLAHRYARQSTQLSVVLVPPPMPSPLPVLPEDCACIRARLLRDSVDVLVAAPTSPSTSSATSTPPVPTPTQEPPETPPSGPSDGPSSEPTDSISPSTPEQS